MTTKQRQGPSLADRLNGKSIAALGVILRRLDNAIANARGHRCFDTASMLECTRATVLGAAISRATQGGTAEDCARLVEYIKGRIEADRIKGAAVPVELINKSRALYDELDNKVSALLGIDLRRCYHEELTRVANNERAIV